MESLIEFFFETIQPIINVLLFVLIVLVQFAFDKVKSIIYFTLIYTIHTYNAQLNILSIFKSEKKKIIPHKSFIPFFSYFAFAQMMQCK